MLKEYPIKWNCKILIKNEGIWIFLEYQKLKANVKYKYNSFLYQFLIIVHIYI